MWNICPVGEPEMALKEVFFYFSTVSLDTQILDDNELNGIVSKHTASQSSTSVFSVTVES